MARAPVHQIFIVLVVLTGMTLTFAAIAGDRRGFEFLGSYKFLGRRGENLESSYYLSTGRAWWETARAACVEEGLGVLVSIETSEEDRIINDLIQRESYSVWTSGSFQDGVSWRWSSTNQIIGYTNWKTSPSYQSNHRVYVNRNPQDGSYGWFTYAMTTSNKYICEKTTVVQQN